jgi:hypothetical protein
MDASLNHLPSDVLRIILRNLPECPFTLGILGRVCRDLYATTNTLEDIWELLATLTPHLGHEIAAPTSENSKVAACRAKLNRFAVLVNRIKLSQGNITVVNETHRPYDPKATAATSSNQSPGTIANYLPEDESELFNTYRLLYSVEAKQALVQTTEECAGSSYLNQRVIGLQLFDIPNGISARRSLSPEWATWRPLMFGDRYLWPTPIEDDISPYELPCADLESEARFLVDLSELTVAEASEKPRFYFNRHSKFPWVMILHLVDPPPMSYYGQDAVGVTVTATISVYDLVERKSIARHVKIAFPGSEPRITSATLFSDYIFFDCVDENFEDFVLCCRVDVENGTVHTLWHKEGDFSVGSVIDNIAMVYWKRRYAFISLSDGAIIMESTHHTYLSQSSAYGRLYVVDYEIWDIFNPSKCLTKLPSAAKVKFLDDSRWMISAGSACHFLDFEAPHEPVDALVTCCALGKIEIGERGSSAEIPVDCEATLIDLNTSNLFQQVCKLLGCSTDEVGYQAIFAYPNRFVFIFSMVFCCFLLS